MALLRQPAVDAQFVSAAQWVLIANSKMLEGSRSTGWGGYENGHGVNVGTEFEAALAALSTALRLHLEGALTAAPVRKVRMLTLNELEQAYDKARMSEYGGNAISRGEEVVRKFCEVNGLTLEEGDGNA